MMNPYGYGYGGYSWLGMGLMMFFSLLVLVGLILLVIWLVRSTEHRGMGPGPYQDTTSQACDIAKMRYARGEITREQYEEICRTVTGAPMTRA